MTSSNPSPANDLSTGHSLLHRLQNRVTNPSPRNPTLSWSNNIADQIAHHLHSDNHHKWGFIIYRTTYSSETDWKEFLRRLQHHMRETFTHLAGEDILEKFEMTVIQDRETLEDVTADSVRRHFQTWAVESWRREQPEAAGMGRSPRYRFAIQVDSESLHSIVHEAPDPLAEVDTTTKGWVKVVDKSWYLGRSGGGREMLEAIEGIEEEDVGWMRVAYQDVMSEWYVKLRDLNCWTLSYRRPPEVVR